MSLRQSTAKEESSKIIFSAYLFHFPLEELALHTKKNLNDFIEQVRLHNHQFAWMLKGCNTDVSVRVSSYQGGGVERKIVHGVIAYNEHVPESTLPFMGKRFFTCSKKILWEREEWIIDSKWKLGEDLSLLPGVNDPGKVWFQQVTLTEQEVEESKKEKSSQRVDRYSSPRMRFYNDSRIDHSLVNIPWEYIGYEKAFIKRWFKGMDELKVLGLFSDLFNDCTYGRYRRDHIPGVKFVNETSGFLEDMDINTLFKKLEGLITDPKVKEGIIQSMDTESTLRGIGRGYCEIGKLLQIQSDKIRIAYCELEDKLKEDKDN